jgi:electron transfer flavoprotein beta subunit
MKAIVALKRVVDYQVKVRVKADRSAVDSDHVKMSINPFDEIALEEALRCKEHGKVSEVIAVSVGDKAAQETLRHALALGADRAILLESNVVLEPLRIAALLKKIVEQEQAQLVLLGKQSIDGDNNQTGQMLAGLLGWPQATFASKLVVSEQKVMVTREVDAGLETLALQLPAVITADLRLNRPRFASLPNIMKAKNKPLTVQVASSLGVDLSPMLETLSVDPPPQRATGEIKQSLTEILAILRQKTEVLA